MSRIALISVDPTVGDLAGNAERIVAAAQAAAQQGAELIVFPEMALTGYPIDDLALRPSFQKAAEETLTGLASRLWDIEVPVLVGGLRPGAEGHAQNILAVLQSGRVRQVYVKQALPNYGVFDERRLFEPGEESGLIEWQGLRVGLLICEDMWTARIVEKLARQKPDIVLSVNGSPFEQKKDALRLRIAHKAWEKLQCPIAYVNLHGGQDELVFDGGFFALNREGEVAAHSGWFAEGIHWLELDGAEWKKQPRRDMQGDDCQLWHAMVLALRDYARKNGFSDVVLGLSGGIDSAVVAAIAVDALGPAHVHGVLLPSDYTHESSNDDAMESARLLGCEAITLPIGPAYHLMREQLSETIGAKLAPVADENIQSRLRGNYLMGLSNHHGWMLLSTGNKSEVAVGYATLYGDMAGGYNPLKDLYKTQVYQLARWRNGYSAVGEGPAGKVIPEHSITRAPSAELRPGQTDQDSLPPYEVLDGILHMMIEEDLDTPDIVAAGYDYAVVERVERLVNRAEYKRRQAAPGVKTSRRAFSRDRRYPMTNHFV